MPRFQVYDTPSLGGKPRRCQLDAANTVAALDRYREACKAYGFDVGTVQIHEIAAAGPAPVFVNPIALDCMDQYGGSFVKALAAAWRLADDGNSQKLAHAFPAILECYTLKADHLASRHAMRDTVSGEAALQAQLNQERAA